MDLGFSRRRSCYAPQPADQHEWSASLLPATRDRRAKGATFAAEQERKYVRAAREAWCEVQPELGPDRLVFLDETAAATNMARRYGWVPRGERCRLAAWFGHYKTTTIMAALRTSGLRDRAVGRPHERHALLPLCHRDLDPSVAARRHRRHG